MKILVVEDEHLARVSIVNSLKKLGYADISEAEDGLEALISVNSYKPDIMLIDIRMPEMDGIQLLNEVQKQHKNIISIIVSSYDLFEYAQTALQLGAFSYLLKPVKDNELQVILSKASDLISRQNEAFNNKIENELTARQYREFAKRQFIHDLVKNEISDEGDIINICSQLDIHMEHNKFAVAVTSIDSYGLISEKLSKKNLDIMKFSIENIALEILSRYDFISYCFDFEEGLGFLLNYKNDTLNGITVNIRKVFQEIKDLISRYMNFTITVGIGSAVDTLADCHDSYLKAEKSIIMRLVKGCNQVYISDNKTSNEKKVFISMEIEQKLLVCFEKCDKSSAFKILYEIYALLNADESERADILMKLNFQVIFTIYRIMNQMGIDIEAALGSELKLYHQVNSCSSMNMIIEFFSKIIELCFDQIKAAPVSWNKKLLGRAMEYIISNYNKDISLSTTAEYVGMSPSYFSKLFKEEYGDNFIDFLIKLRINRARDYLKENNFTVTEVAGMVGFYDEKHFYRTFKKIIGITPGKYKKLR